MYSAWSFPALTTLTALTALPAINPLGTSEGIHDKLAVKSDCDCSDGHYSVIRGRQQLASRLQCTEPYGTGTSNMILPVPTTAGRCCCCSQTFHNEHQRCHGLDCISEFHRVINIPRYQVPSTLHTSRATSYVFRMIRLCTPHERRLSPRTCTTGRFTGITAYLVPGIAVLVVAARYLVSRTMVGCQVPGYRCCQKAFSWHQQYEYCSSINIIILISATEPILGSTDARSNNNGGYLPNQTTCCGRLSYTTVPCTWYLVPSARGNQTSVLLPAAADLLSLYEYRYVEKQPANCTAPQIRGIGAHCASIGAPTALTFDTLGNPNARGTCRPVCPSAAGPRAEAFRDPMSRMSFPTAKVDCAISLT